MKIIEIKEMENCFDGDFMKDVLFDSEITSDFIQHMGNFGELQYFPSFARPFFRVDVPDKIIIKGIEGNKNMRLYLSRNDINGSLEFFESIVSEFPHS